MSDIRAEHQGAARAAIDNMNELSGILFKAKEMAETTMASSRAAVGETGQESGTNAVSMLSGVSESIEECLGMVSGAMSEMERYAGGF